MTTPERGKLIPVTGENDDPDMDNAIDVQFNPATLKINLSNTLKASEQNGSSSAAQFVEKSSSSLALELMFDTTRAEDDSDFEQGSDVRALTGNVARQFIQPEKSGSDMKAPKRCLFQWGAFEFIGLVESYDETLEYFSPGGTPLRAKLALKLKEDRFQFRQTEGFQDPTEPAMPELSPTGKDENSNTGTESSDNSTPENQEQETEPVPGPSEGKNNWRDTAEYNGIENPRMPGVSVLATPTPGCQPRAGLSAGLSAALSVSGSVSASMSADMGAGAAVRMNLGASAAISGSASVTTGVSASVSANAGIKSRIKTDTGVGFD